MTTRREFVGIVGAAAGAAMLPYKTVNAPPVQVPFDMDSMCTLAYPLSTPLKDIWPTQAYNKKYLDEVDAWRLTQTVVDYLQKESIDAYLVTFPCVLIAGSPHIVRSRKMKSRYVRTGSMEELGREFAEEVKMRATGRYRIYGETVYEEPRSVGLMGFGTTPLMIGENLLHRKGVVGRYLVSKTPAREVLRLAELTRRAM